DLEGKMRLKRSTLSLLLLAGLVACGKSGPDTPVLAASPAVVAPAPPAPAAATPRNSPLTASGPLLVENQVDVAAQRPGQVSKLLADVGQAVSKGQLLAALDDRQLSAERDAALARLHSAEANLNDWQAETRMAEADFQAITLELEKTHIRAPFDGVVARRYVRVGQEIATGDRIFWVTAVRPLRVKFTLPENFIGRIKVGQNLALTCLDEPGVRHQAKVIQVSPVVDPSSGTFEVLAQVVNPGGNLRPGMTASVSLENLK